MKWIAYLLMLVVIPALHSQDTLLISQEGLREQLKKQNLQIQIADQQVLSAQGEFRQSNALLFPSISVSHTGISTTNPLMAFGSRLNQEILTSADFNPDLLNDPENIKDFATRVEITQPLLNMDGLFQRKAAKAKWNAMAYQSERTRENVTLQLEQAYMSLQLAYKTVEVLKKARETAAENKRLAQNLFDQGFLQKSDMLAVEVRLADITNQLISAESGVRNASNFISFLTNDTDYPLLKPMDSLVARPFVEAPSKVSEHRKDIMAAAASAEAYRYVFKAEKMNFLPKLNAFGTYELHDQDVFQGAANGYLIGAELRWNILEGTRRFGSVQKTKADFEKSKLEYKQYEANSQVELQKARRMLQDAKNNLELTSLALQQSQEALRIRSNRFKEGLEKTSDLLMAESQYAQKQLEYYATIYKHNYAIAYVQFLTKE